MEKVSSRPHEVRFAAFAVDLQAGELRKHGVKIKLQEQPFQILLVLLERPGEVVTREELQKRLWSGNTFVDFEHSLATAVKKLRRALGDSAAHSQFIETLPRRGYRFIATLEAEPRTGKLICGGAAVREPDTKRKSMFPRRCNHPPCRNMEAQTGMRNPATVRFANP